MLILVYFDRPCSFNLYICYYCYRESSLIETLQRQGIPAVKFMLTTLICIILITTSEREYLNNYENIHHGISD